MNEVTEMWKVWKKMKQSAATQRRVLGPEALVQKGISFSTHNGGAHLILDTKIGFIDFWPGTTKWKTREVPIQTGHGLAKLLELLE